MVDQFISILETFLGATKEYIRIADKWAESPPDAAKGKSLKEYIDKMSNPLERF
jgi:hypothetical protein